MHRDCDFNIVLLHDDLVSGLRGESILVQLAAQLEMASEGLGFTTWNFDVLHQSGRRKQAISRIMEANMVILSAALGGDLPVHIKNLLEIALSLRHGRKAALVVLLDWEETAGKTLPPLGSQLRELAAKLDVDFFCNRTVWQSCQSSSDFSAIYAGKDGPKNSKVSLQGDSDVRGWIFNE